MTQRALLLLASLLAASFAQASARDDVLTALTKCADQPDASARLDCYDRLAPQVRAATATHEGPQAHGPTDPASAGPALPSPHSTNPATAGTNIPATSNAYMPIGGEILPMEMSVASYQIKRDGTFTVTLDNDQVWRSLGTSTSGDRLHFEKDKKNIVVITRGLIGSFDLHVKGTSKFFRVERVK